MSAQTSADAVQAAPPWVPYDDETWHAIVVAKMQEIEARLADDDGVEDFYDPAMNPPDNVMAFPEDSSILKIADILGARAPLEPIFAHGPRRGDLGLIIAESGKSKTFMAQAIAAGVATGETTLLTFAPQGFGDVVYVSYEDQPCVIKQRMEAIGWAFNIEEELRIAIEDRRLIFCCDAPPLFNPSGRGVVISPAGKKLNRLLERYAPDLVIIDPLSVAAALDDENGNGILGQIAQSLVTLARKHDCAILLIHHASKRAAETPSQHMARGGSALACRSRWIATITAGDIPGGVYDGGALLEVNVVKDSYAPPPPPLLLRRGPRGVVQEVSRKELQDAAVARLAAALADLIGDNHDDLSKWDIVKNSRGKDLRATLKSAFGDAACTQIKLGAAFDMAVEQELLKVEISKIGGVEKAIPRLAVQ